MPLNIFGVSTCQSRQKSVVFFFLIFGVRIVYHLLFAGNDAYILFSMVPEEILTNPRFETSFHSCQV